MDNTIDIHEDSGRYLQEYIQSLENLPSEIQYHWAEIRNRYDQAKAPERRIRSGQHDLAKIHKQWFTQEIDKREKLLKSQPILIQRIKNDYNKLEDLANERVSLAEEALKLVDRHLIRLQQDLDKHDREHPELAPVNTLPTRSYTIAHGRRQFDLDLDEEDEEEEEEELDDESSVKSGLDKNRDKSQTYHIKKLKEEEEDNLLVFDPDYYETMLANRHQKKKKKEAREATDKEEPLYCYCQQVSYGEMVACDGEHCPYEWFHMECVGVEEPPKGAWFCEHCSAELRNHKRKTSNNNHHPLLNTKKMKRRKESSA
ncbi:uncharacterized protein BX663DRAFT_509334 [Cokeromyces recurvatus]|uniref:uncharacterized protein n=1 Tax=Cokeromyces recurvatus TaxID=90255 RepID=UPI00221E4D43|nr:uncharacterized protein BX663DRAFT_509334 [Cokeromyces recurvatus]KAI7903044.1 hypothetical protein BX663DRAFT_509334 [Cokeromyces recurvatus]